jgi:hypothetical protein
MGRTSQPRRAAERWRLLSRLTLLFSGTVIIRQILVVDELSCQIPAKVD